MGLPNGGNVNSTNCNEKNVFNRIRVPIVSLIRPFSQLRYFRFFPVRASMNETRIPF